MAGREEIDETTLMAKLDELFRVLEEDGFTLEIVEKLKEIVPDFQPEKSGQPAQVRGIQDPNYKIVRDFLSEQNRHQQP